MVCAFILDAAPVRQAETCHAPHRNDSTRCRLAFGHPDQAIGGGCAHESAIAIGDLREIVCFLASSQALECEVSYSALRCCSCVSSCRFGFQKTGGKSETRRASAGCSELSVFGCGLVRHTQTKAVAEFLAMGLHVHHDRSLRC